MTQIVHGDRVGREGRIRLGCSAVIFDPTREKILLTQRVDNQLWCLPSGGVEPGESVAEACAREVWEETGLKVRIKRLTGVYSDPHRLVVYADGHKAHIIALNFEAEIIEGKPGLSNETSAIGWYSYNEMDALPFLLNHKERILDTLQNQMAAFVK